MTRSWSFYVLSLVAGYASMALEMTAIRALAPAFGTSAFVWAVVIGMVMCLMFAGSLLGGRVAGRGLGTERVCDVLVVAALVAMVSSQVTLWALSTHAPSLVGPPFSIAVALLGSAFLVSCPILLLSCVPPWLIGIAAREGAEAGGASGRIYAAGTFGGLVGTFVPVLVLVPLVGSRVTFISTGLVLTVCATSVRWTMGRSTRGSSILSASSVLGAGLLMLPEAPKSHVIDRAESIYNAIVVKDDGIRIDLEVNEGRVIQSRSYHDPDRLPEDVWALYLTADFFTPSGPGKKILFLGLGAGSAAVYYHRFFPEHALVGVEIDPAIVDMGKRHFGLDRIPIRIEVMDGRRFLHNGDEQFDIIVADAFSFPYLPAHLSTLEFMSLVDSRLAPDGVALFNVGRYEDHREVVDSITSTGLQVFSHAYQYDLNNEMNTLVFLADHPLDTSIAEHPDRRLTRMARRVARALKPASVRAGMVSTDDRPLSEWLTHRVVLEAFGLI